MVIHFQRNFFSPPSANIKIGKSADFFLILIEGVAFAAPFYEGVSS